MSLSVFERSGSSKANGIGGGLPANRAKPGAVHRRGPACKRRKPGRDRAAGSRIAAPAAVPAQFDLEDFFENGAVPLHLVGEDGTILRANRAELELLGYSADEYVGRPIAEFHHDQAAIADILARLKRGEKVEKYPTQLRAKDGSIKHVLVTSSVQ